MSGIARPLDRADVCSVDCAGGRVEALRTVYRAQRFPRHAHETHAMGVGLRGVGAIWYRGRDYFQRPDDVVVIPAGEMHTGGIGPRAAVVAYIAVYMPQTVLAEWGAFDATPAHSGRFPDFSAPVIQDASLAAAFRHLHHRLWPSGSQRSPGSRNPLSPAPRPDHAGLEEDLCGIVALLEGRAVSHGATKGQVHDEPSLVRLTREILNDCYANPRQTALKELARQLGVTAYHLVRAFTRQTTISPHQYLLQVRVRHARALLAQGKPPSIVAAMLGFTDQSHLTTCFRRFTGITPAHYQRCLGVDRA